MFELSIVYFFAAVMLLSAPMVITVRNPVHAALFLVLAFFASATIWLLMRAEFLAIILILVYVGAVMVLFLFVVMMLDINLAKMREGFAQFLPVGVVVAVLMADKRNVQLICEFLRLDDRRRDFVRGAQVKVNTNEYFVCFD